jgi:hypothetical protein
MTDKISFPPLHDPPPGELAMRRQHLLSEVTREPEKTGLSLPTLAFRRSRLASVRPILVAAVVVVAALALVPIGGASLGSRAVNSVVSLWDTSPPDQPELDAAANDAEAIAGSYYTEARVDDAADKVDLYLASAPQSVIDQLQAKHPGIYVIHNDSAHPLSELRRIQNSLPLKELQSKGIDVVSAGATPQGYLSIGITGHDVQAAQATFDSMYGAGIIKVYGGAQPGSVTPYGGTVSKSQLRKLRRHH